MLSIHLEIYSWAHDMFNDFNFLNRTYRCGGTGGWFLNRDEVEDIGKLSHPFLDNGAMVRWKLLRHFENIHRTNTGLPHLHNCIGD